MRLSRRLLLAFSVCTLALLAFGVEPAMAAHALPLADPSWVDGFTLHAVGGGAAVATAGAAVPKGTLAKVMAKLKATFTGEGTPSDADIEAALAAELTEADPAPPATPATPPAAPPSDMAAAITQAVQAAVAPLQAELSTVKGALESEAAARVAAQQAMETQRTQERETAIAAALDAAAKDGRIVPAKRADWETRLKADFDSISPILAELPANPALGKASAKSASTSAEDGTSTKAERPAPGSMAGSLSPAALSYVTENTN